MAKAKKLPSGNWRVLASANGQTKSFTNFDRKKAEAEAKMWQAGMYEKYSSDNITLYNCFENFIESKSNVLSPSTIRGYNKIKNNSLQDIMNLNVNSLTNLIIQKSINIYAASHSPKSVRNCYGLLSAVLKMFRPDFNLQIKLPQKEHIEMYIPTNEDIQRLVSISKNTNCYIPILLAAFGGMRLGEICALDSSDINGNYITINKSIVYTPDKKWVIKPPKTFSSNRKVEMPQFVINELQGKSGKIIECSAHAITLAFGKLLERNNFPHFRFHDLRHYYVSTLHSINIPDKYIQAQGGWATNHTMNNVYKHIMSNQQSEFSSQISTHFNDIFNN